MIDQRNNLLYSTRIGGCGVCKSTCYSQTVKKVVQRTGKTSKVVFASADPWPGEFPALTANQLHNAPQSCARFQADGFSKVFMPGPCEALTSGRGMKMENGGSAVAASDTHASQSYTIGTLGTFIAGTSK